ncbi:MAG TPA: hypothetical protein VF503_09015 [Sphingobium sp.]|uniref:hypothetical protein n=1 Tax=Sphingobium sp. TaxID=1912891 RepID=UPI002ED1AD03
MSNQHPEWTEAEEQILHRMSHQGASNAEMAAATGRSIFAVKNRRKKLGITAAPVERYGDADNHSGNSLWEDSARDASRRLAAAIGHFLARREEVAQ